MRNLILTTAAVAAAIGLAGCSEKPAQEPASETQTEAEIDTVTGMLTDKRDGQTYRTVVIGGDRWMAQNLNYKTDSSWCYKNADSNCVKYGRMYNWEAAKEACPAGWHLPSREEWDSLGSAVGGRRRMDTADFSLSGADKKLNAKLLERLDSLAQKVKGIRWVGYTVDWSDAGKKLKARSGWFLTIYQNGNGTDDYKFSALPGGRRYGSKTFIDGANEGGRSDWWSAANYDDDDAYHRYVISIGNGLYEDHSSMGHGYSVRCVRNGSGAAEEKRKEEYEQYLQWVAEKRTEKERKKKEEEQRIEELSVYFIDSRDGRKYRAVTIGGKVWMAENLSYKTDGSWCYINIVDDISDDSDNYSACYGGRGRLYDWNAAKAACPSGWRLPSDKEWDALVAAAGGKKAAGTKLKAKDWDGTDDYGFSALPGGYRFSSGSSFYAGVAGHWWTATSSGNKNAHSRCMYHDFAYSGVCRDNILKNDAISVRCLRDTGDAINKTP